MRRNREPGTRNPLSWPLSKQRMMVCWLTLQILAASPVVNTVFMGTSTPARSYLDLDRPANPLLPQEGGGPRSSLTSLSISVAAAHAPRIGGLASRVSRYRECLNRINPEIRRSRPSRNALPILPMMWIIPTLQIVSMRACLAQCPQVLGLQPLAKRGPAVARQGD